MKRILLYSLITCLTLASFVLSPTKSTAFGDDWKPVTPEELKLTAEQVSPNSDAAILFSETYIDDSDFGGVTFSEYIRIKVFNDRGVEQAANRSVSYFNDERIKDIKARTIKPDGSVVELKKEDIHEKTLIKISKGSLKEKNFTMPNVSPGSIVEYRYKRTSGNDLSRFTFDIQQDFFAREVSVYIKPFEYENKGMRWIMFNQQTGEKIEPKKEKSWYAIKAHNVPGLKEEPMTPPSKMRRTWGLLWYTSNTEANVDKYWAAYAQRASDNLKEFTNKNKEIKKIVPTIVSPNDDPVTKARKLSDYVQQQVRNISLISEGEINFGKLKDINGADDVLKVKVGDSDLINVLYVSMLQVAGVDAHIARLTSRATDIFRKNLTESFQFTDYVAAVRGPDGKFTIYDPGTPLSPFGYVSWEKQAVSCLVLDKNSEFVPVPLATSDMNSINRSGAFKIDSTGTIIGDVNVKYTGEEAVELKTDLYPKSEEEQIKHWRGHFSENIPNFSSKDEKIENIKENSKPLAVSFNMRVPDYASKTGKRLLLLPSAFTRGQKSPFPSADRVQDMYFHYPWSEKDHIEFVLPEGYTVEEVPQPVIVDKGKAVYKATFKVEGNKLIFDRELHIDLLMVPANSYAVLKDFFDQVYKADQTPIPLKQGS